MKGSLFLPFLISASAGLLLAVVVASAGWGFSALFVVAASVALALLWTRWIRRDARVLETAVSEIGAGKNRLAGDGSNTSFRDFEDLAYAIRQASGRVDRSLARADESRQELEAMIDSMLDAVIAVDAAGRIQWTNQKVQKLIPGMPFSGAVRVGHALVQTIRDPDVLDCMRVALEQRIVSERRSTSLLPGKIFEIAASPMPGGGAVAVLHDITRIEQVERTQRDFVANVSHELRTPLTSITGYVETLLDHEQGLSPQAREFLTTIHKNATRMNRLTEDLLVMARVESSEQELHPVNLRADMLVRDAVQAMSGMVQDEEAVLEIGETVPDEVLADQDAAVQVLSNLIENAIKYGRRPAERHSSRVIVSAHSQENFVEFHVQDFGPGIASEHLQRIFERFYRVDKARSRESGGTGLGLAIARHVIESLGGAIRVDSELNVGSTFIFSLPRSASTTV